MKSSVERASATLSATFAEHAERITRFGTVGAICAVLNLVSLWVMTDKFGFHYLISVSVAFVLINFIGFLLNRWYAFRSRTKAVVKEAGRYYIAMAVTFAANLALMYVLVNLFSIHYLVASIIVTVLFFLWNYTLHLMWTFRHRDSAP